MRKYPDTFPERLRKLRLEWHKMILNFFKVVEVIRQRKGFWSLEWSERCKYWNTPMVKQFLKAEKGKVYNATATGCAFGSKAIAGKDKGKPMSKAWQIEGNLPALPDYLERNCACPRSTVHAQAAGANTAHTGRYTPLFVASVHRMFAFTIAKNNDLTRRDTERGSKPCCVPV